MASADELIAGLTLDEKAALTAGADFWSTPPIERVGLPAVRVTDGPNGARGPSLPGAGPGTSVCVPCGSALGASWDADLVERVGALLGREARRKTCRVLLAPTVNIHRSPLAGRNFECYSEDPFLSGKLAAAFVRGAQSEGVATTVKHFVGNDAEFQRNTMSSVIDERTLREIYLLPFELAVREGGSLGVMTGYNRLNGQFCTENTELMRILREEWSFEGFVITDWYGVASTVGSARAGVDLEMPGPGRAFGPAIAAAVRAGDLDESVLDGQARRLLGVFERVGALADIGSETPVSVDVPEDRALAREAATAGIVLLANRDALPLDTSAISTVAVIGPNANRAVIMGGGSAHVDAPYWRSPLAALSERFDASGVVTLHEPGVDINRTAPTLAGQFHVEYFNGTTLAGDVVAKDTLSRSEALYLGPPNGVTADFSFRATGSFVAPQTGSYSFSLVQAGRARLSVDGRVVVDGHVDPPPIGISFFGLGSEEIEAAVDLEAGRPVEVVIEYASVSASGLFGVKVGWRPLLPDDALDRAVSAAAEADVVIVVVGTTDEWESEGSDRETMALPGDQDRLIQQVAAANPRTVVVVNSGAPVAMPWADDVAAIVQLWFGGQEMSDALADVLSGVDEPGGRLPTTIPQLLEHNPSFGNFPGADDEVRYGEGLLVGYRWYDTRSVTTRFPFGHGLSYTTFELGTPQVEPAVFEPGSRLSVSVSVTNTGTRPGSEVVQLYVAPPTGASFRPGKELKAFAKVRLEAGEMRVVDLSFDDRSFARWDVGSRDSAALHARVPIGGSRADSTRETPGWVIEPGVYRIGIGRSVSDIVHWMEVPVGGPRIS